MEATMICDFNMGMAFVAKSADAMSADPDARMRRADSIRRWSAII
jgi:hypothetical protein